MKLNGMLPAFTVFSSLLVTRVATRSLSISPLQVDSAKEKLHEICREICSQSRGDLTFVFVLHTTANDKTSFNFLWQLPNAQVYLSTEYFPLKDQDREITISWERDDQPKHRAVSDYWDIHKGCGLRNCNHAVETIDQFHLEKRVLIQIREFKGYEWVYFPPFKIRRILDSSLSMAYYYHRYRCTLVLVRKLNEDTLHSTSLIKRSGRMFGKHVARLLVKEFAMSDVENFFDSKRHPENKSATINLAFSEIFAPDGTKNNYIQFNSCIPVSIQES